MRVEIKAEPQLRAVERATLADVPALVIMGEAMVREAPWLARYGIDVDRLRTHLSEMIGGTDAALNAVVLVARQGDGAPVGVFVGVDIGGHPWARVRCAQELAMWVWPDWRGRGVATKLIAAFEGWAREQGAQYVEIGAGSGLAHDATTRLYAKHGYALSNQTFTKHLEGE